MPGTGQLGLGGLFYRELRGGERENDGTDQHGEKDGTTGEQRSPILPDVPTIAEAGVPGYTASGWVGIVAPVATPKPIIDLLNGEISKTLTSPEIKESWAKQGMTPMSMTPAEFGVFINAEIEKYARLAQTAGIKIN